MQVLSGKEVSQATLEKLRKDTEAFAAKYKRKPGLAVILVGVDPASEVYVRNKVKTCVETGFNSFHHPMPTDHTPKKLEELIKKLNADKNVDGILLQLPLPKDYDKDYFMNLIAPEKDVDGLGYDSQGRLFAGKPHAVSCTPKGVMRILDFYNIKCEGKSAVVVGRSEIVGKPMAQLLLAANATVTICHSKTPDVNAVTKNADIVVVAAGKPRFMGKESFKKNSVVIDVGIHRQQVDGKTKLCGDVRYEELEGHVAAATPVPGGVGPMTIAMLMENTLELARLHQS
jgi:methylenetetrahydrofolate dehydrogenase (NADP+) / methenyltetrahydrofolate cyclohydrolase